MSIKTRERKTHSTITILRKSYPPSRRHQAVTFKNTWRYQHNLQSSISEATFQSRDFPRELLSCRFATLLPLCSTLRVSLRGALIPGRFALLCGCRFVTLRRSTIAASRYIGGSLLRGDLRVARGAFRHFYRFAALRVFSKPISDKKLGPNQPPNS